MSSFLRRLRKNPNKKLNVLLEEDYKAIEFFKSKGFDINYVTLSFFRVCKSKKQIIKLNKYNELFKSLLSIFRRRYRK